MWNVSKYGVFSGPYFPAFPAYLSVFSPNVGKYGPEKTPYLDIFDAVKVLEKEHKTFSNNFDKNLVLIEKSFGNRLSFLGGIVKVVKKITLVGNVEKKVSDNIIS